MIFNKSKYKWRVIGKSVRGASHEDTGLPNQDAICWSTESGAGLPLILSVADGHGNTKNFRSDIGSELAVNTVTKVIKDFLNNLSETDNLSSIKNWAEEKLPRKIVYCWKTAVADNLSVNPFRISELDKVEVKEGPNKRRHAVINPVLAYGSTILSVLVTKSFIIYLQLGDGDILVVSEKGEVSRPIPKDDRLFANETTSLCLQTACQDFHVAFQVVLDQPPALILLSTDGYSNSFVNDASFLKVGTDILEMVRSEGISEVDKNLKSWLRESSEKSGDDVTLGVIYRMDIQRKCGLVVLPTQKDKTERELANRELKESTKPALQLTTNEIKGNRCEEESK